MAAFRACTGKPKFMSDDWRARLPSRAGHDVITITEILDTVVLAFHAVQICALVLNEGENEVLIDKACVRSYPIAATIKHDRPTDDALLHGTVIENVQDTICVNINIQSCRCKYHGAQPQEDVQQNKTYSKKHNIGYKDRGMLGYRWGWPPHQFPHLTAT